MTYSDDDSGRRGLGYFLSLVPILAVIAFLVAFGAAGFGYVFGPNAGATSGPVIPAGAAAPTVQ